MPPCRHRRLLSVATVLAVMSSLPGCGAKEDGRIVHVSGTVTFDGRPLPAGMIIFEPDPGKGNSGPQGHADIKDGHFDTRLSKKGTVTRPLVVRITGGDSVHPEPFAPFGTMLFDEYTVRIDLAKDQPSLQFDIPKSRSRR